VTTQLVPPGVLPAYSVGPRRLTAGLDRHHRLDLARHLDVHGPVSQLSAEQLVELAERIGLTGRGGAGFPFARKLQAVQKSVHASGSSPAVVVNATEGEPASFKDKMLLRRAPHLILDGAFLAASAIGAQSISIGVEEGEPGADSLVHALGERPSPTVTRVVTVPKRFISGEGGALVRGINGEVPIPPGRKTRASESGVKGLPTLLSNAETYAQLALAARTGPRGYAHVGLPHEPGTVLLTIGGATRIHCIVETPTGVPLDEILYICGATIGPGVLVGGYHGAWLSPAALSQAAVSREGLSAVGGALGAGVVLPLGEGTCPLGEAARVLQYLAGESAGQCGPCRRGLPEVARRMSTLVDGSGGFAAVDAIRAAAGGVRGRGACAHPDGTARFALSALDAFAEDVSAHVFGGGCGLPVRGVLPIADDADAGPTLTVDWTRCDAHGLCAHILPELISLDANGYPAIADRTVPAWLSGQARKAITMCPALALRFSEAQPR
jgi:NADH:ubiquinone oxidoreductase subunit F (NADH-binding)/ferredoxin